MFIQDALQCTFWYLTEPYRTQPLFFLYRIFLMGRRLPYRTVFYLFPKAQYQPSELLPIFGEKARIIPK